MNKVFEVFNMFWVDKGFDSINPCRMLVLDTGLSSPSGEGTLGRVIFRLWYVADNAGFGGKKPGNIRFSHTEAV